MNFKSYFDLSHDIQRNIQLLQSRDFDLIVGIPRSGVIPAYMIALLLNTHCTDLPSLIADAPLKHGKTRNIKKNSRLMHRPSNANSILLVDDSISTGNSLTEELAQIPETIRSKIITLAVYSSKENRNDVDIFFEFVPMPRAFEWNLFHHIVLNDACVDIDGILCEDPTQQQNDDGSRYIDFMLNTKPIILPTQKIHSLVTNRLEKYRKETELWLNNNGIEYENLIMLNLPSKEERVRQKAHSIHKANYYKSSNTQLFIESDKRQAIEISRITNKVVYCYEDNAVYLRGKTNEFTKHGNYLFNGKQVGIISLIAKRIKHKSKSVLQRLKKYLRPPL